MTPPKAEWSLIELKRKRLRQVMFLSQKMEVSQGKHLFLTWLSQERLIPGHLKKRGSFAAEGGWPAQEGP